MSIPAVARRLHYTCEEVYSLICDGTFKAMYSQDDRRLFIPLYLVKEHERSINMNNENNVPWIGTEILDKEKTEAFRNR